jgi:hypothetical protein
MHWLSSPQRIKASTSTDCDKTEATVSFVPAEATAIIATATTFNSVGNDFVVYSFGRNNSHTDCNASGLHLQTVDTYFNDVLLSQNGQEGGFYPNGTSSGTIIIPLTVDNKVKMTLAMGQSVGINYITLLVYGYMTGDFLVPIEDVDVDRQSTTVRASARSNTLTGMPTPPAVVFATMSTYDLNNGNDHFSVAAGRTNNVPLFTWRNDPYTETADYYGDVIISHVRHTWMFNLVKWRRWFPANIPV